jgi:hypothetical protein
VLGRDAYVAHMEEEAKDKVPNLEYFVVPSEFEYVFG